MDGQRFAAYVAEFREFSRFHKVGFGHPHDLLTLAHSLESSERFRVEFGSMVRAVFYREGGAVMQKDVLRLIAVAWGGEDEDATQMDGQLARFVQGVLSRPAGEPQPILTEEIEEETAVPEKAVAPREIFHEAAMREVPELEAVKTNTEDKKEPQRYTEKAALVERADPWGEGSYLRRVLLRFAEQQAGG